MNFVSGNFSIEKAKAGVILSDGEILISEEFEPFITSSGIDFTEKINDIFLKLVCKKNTNSGWELELLVRNERYSHIKIEKL